MSTRCNIGFYKATPKQKDLLTPEALLYKHSDGYQENMLPLLTDFLKRFNVVRGLEDIEYASAHTLVHIVNSQNGEMKKWTEEQGREYREDFCGFGICKPEFLHWDIEYFYAISPEHLQVYAVNMPYDAKKMLSKHFTLLDTIKLK